MRKFVSVCIFLLFAVFVTAQTKDFRKNVDILSYDINLNLIKLQKKEISGNTVVKLIPQSSGLKEIILELEGLHVDSVFFLNDKINDYSYNGKLLKINCIEELPNEKCGTGINIYYHGNPIQDESWGGFFFTDSSAYNIGVGMSANPNSYGRIWFPCIDSFEEKATYKFNITTDKDYKAVCSGTLTNETQNSDGTVTYRWELNQQVSPYLVSVAVAKYDVAESIYKGIKRNIPVSLYMFPEDIAYAVESFKHLPDALSAYENQYGEYVWERVGYVEVPFMSGAMEHVCNIAYPEYAVDSTTYRETLMAHELSHHWFGNLVTCKTSGDMWLNEGWAVFSEALFTEWVYGKDAYKDYVRENHAKVLTTAHVYDRGYRALYNIPHEYTYGTTVYDKGGDVVHTLRYYLQDSVFFNSVKAYLKEYSYKSASTYDLRDFLSKNTGIDLSDFFDTWVFTEGFPHFIIKETNIDEQTAEVILGQYAVERDFYGNNNFIDLTIVDKNMNLIIERVNMSGPEQKFVLTHSDKILNVFLDLDEKISDATIDNYKIIKETGDYDFLYTDFSIRINKIKAKILVQAILNMNKIPNPKTEDYNISKVKYWEIRGAESGKSDKEGSFFVNMGEHNFIEDFDDVILLYRKDINSEFIPVKTELLAQSDEEGLIIVKDLKFGQYHVAVEK